ncbi:hypothetical protein SAY87_031469 [Trapa incisa]|uniref:Phosphoglycerate mutase family protein n=1 Tax=Trapa incisa TaxID=236973 RepID=A0AAN7KPR8_9MYRT|nr:hypothetical protein SAY87_031469 [Trapa incisa]
MEFKLPRFSELGLRISRFYRDSESLPRLPDSVSDILKIHPRSTLWSASDWRVLFYLLNAAMDCSAAISSYQNCKIIHWVRHAQGIHNVESEKNHDALLSPALLDAQLSPLGLQQVNELRKHVLESGILGRIELVVTSPLSRTMETAIGVFRKSDELEKLPFLAVELCRERIIETDDDELWTPDHREIPEEIAARGVKFMNWLRTRPEKEMAVVTHSVFLLHVLNRFAEGCKPGKSNFLKNCELRSMALVDGSVSGVDPPQCPDPEVATTLETSLKLAIFHQSVHLSLRFRELSRSRIADGEKLSNNHLSRKCSFPIKKLQRRLLLEVIGLIPAMLYAPVLAAPMPEMKEPEVIRTLKLPDGVRFQEIIEGEGTEACEGDTVEINYVCRRSNGYFVHSTVNQFSGESRPVILPLDDNKLINHRRLTLHPDYVSCGPSFVPLIYRSLRVSRKSYWA